MKSKFSSRWICAAAMAALWPLSAVADDPVNGATLYNTDCVGCHGSSPQTVDTSKIGNGRNSRAVNDAAITLVGAMTSLRSKYPSGGSNLADIAAYLGSAPAALTFASTPVGTTSATQSITVYPSLKSGQDLSGITVATTGDFARNGGTCGTTLPAGAGSCTLLVQFAPTAPGARSGTVTLQHSNTLTPISFALSGTGAASGQVPGTLDAGFGIGGKAIAQPGGSSQTVTNRAAALQSDGKILVAGTSDGRFTVTRFLANGSIDTSFGSGGMASQSGGTATSIAIQADGRIVVAGFGSAPPPANTGPDFAVMRFTSAGQLDTSFNGTGFVLTSISTVFSNGSPDDKAYGVAIQADQKIVVVGYTTTRDPGNSSNSFKEMAVVRYNTDGTGDSSFGPGGIRTTALGPSTRVIGYAVAIQPDGKIVVGGETVLSNPSFAAVRFHGLAATGTPGTLDTGFGSSGVVTVNAISCSPCHGDDGARGLAIQPDGMIVLAGYIDNSLVFSSQPNNNTGDMNFGVVRLNANGSRDMGFGASGVVTTRISSSLPSTGNRSVPYDQAHGVAVQTDGKIVVVGESKDGNYFDFAIARYNSDGTLDMGFGTDGNGKVITPVLSGPAFTSDGARAVLIQSDGKIVAAGYSTNPNSSGPEDFVLVRYVGSSAPLSAINPRDLNADGKSDLVWQNTATGQRVIWYMNGTTYGGTGDFGTLDPAWAFVDTGDFNGDGKPDMVLQNTVTGERYVWFLDGINITSAAFIATVAPVWQIAVVGDFNNDGKPDLVFQNTSTGQRVVWFMNGASYAGTADFGTLDPAWQFVGSGDFNGDGKPDMVLQNTSSGDRYIWFMDGTSIIGAHYIGNTPIAWSIAGTGDYNGDGKPDIVLQNTSTGERFVWLMNGPSYASGASLPTVGTSWSLVP